jgi:hypothetical protein
MKSKFHAPSEEYHAKRITKEDKSDRLIFIVFGIVIVIVSIYFLGPIVNDSVNVSVCKNDFLKYAKDNNMDVKFVSAYANDDFDKWNFGKDIACDVFYHDVIGSSLSGLNEYKFLGGCSRWINQI